MIESSEEFKDRHMVGARGTITTLSDLTLYKLTTI